MTDKITVRGFSDDEQETLTLLYEQLKAKARRNLLRASYYDMRHVVKLVGSVIPPQYWRLGIVLGWSGKAVDTLARRCNLNGFVWPDGTLDDIGFREVWEGNNLASEVNQAVISSLIHATGFAVNTLGDESEGEPAGLIHFKHAMDATGAWNARRRRLDNLLSITGRDDKGKPNSLVLYLDGLTLTAVKSDTGWVEVDRQEHPWGVPAEPLVYKPRVGRPFGSSRISRAVMGLQDQATRATIRLEAHSDIYAIPDLWMFGADESIFKNQDGTLKQSWQIVMGRVKGLPDNDDAPDNLARADVKQFPAASPEPHLASLNAYAKMFARETALPDTAVAITDVSNPTSAESYDASQYELIAEAEGATDDWRPALRRTVIRALAMQNGVKAADIPPEWATMDTKWRSPRFLSRAAEADAGVKQLAAVPWLAESEVGLELLGLSEQQIKRALSDKRRVAGTATLAEIRQSVAARVAAGGAEQV